MTYILPFSYFLRTRLLKNSPAFHIIFEWGGRGAAGSTMGAVRNRGIAAVEPGQLPRIHLAL